MKYRRIAVLCLSSLLVVGLSACSGDDGDDDNGGNLADTGPTDTMQPDTEQDPDTDSLEDSGMDAGSDTEADTGPACEYFSNMGCNTSTQNCYPDPRTGGRTCLPYNPNNGKGDSCPGSLNQCNDGLVCLRFEGQSNGFCRTTCNPNDGSRCGDNETCVSPFDGVSSYGACRPNCTLWPDDNCMGQQKCVPVQEIGGNQCQPYNPDASPGDTCGSDTTDTRACGQTSLCVGIQGEQTDKCRAFCNNENPCENSNQSCQVVTGGLTVCLPSGN